MRRFLLIVGGGLALGLAARASWPALAELSSSSALEALGWDAGAQATRQAVDVAAVAALTPVAWLLLGWLGAIAVVAGVAAGPGPGAATARRLLARIAPRLVRRAIAALAGASLTAGVWAGPALADPSPPQPAPAGSSYDWGPPAPSAAPTPTPLATAERIPPAHDTDAPPIGAVVTVRPGDSLWRIAARSLAAAGDAVGDAAIAAAWPRWYDANRSLIGPDPGLIHPGQQLTAPAEAALLDPGAPTPPVDPQEP